MKSMVKKNVSKKVKEEVESTNKVPAPIYEEAWLRSGLVVEETPFGNVYKRVTRYEPDHFHGNIALQELSQALENWRNAKIQHPLAPVANKPLVFFDTETTGLKGTGAVIFLIGLLELSDKQFIMTQYVLPSPDHEAAFLYATRFWEKQQTLVMYNGKSFDMPMLETRWTMNREQLPPLLSHHQIDLLHGSRRIWKGDTDSFKLTQVEEDQLGFVREEDIPGFLAPIIYQDAVKSGNPKLLQKVLVHNEWDILSLVTLYIRTTELLLTTDAKESATVQTNVAKWFSDLKNDARSKQLLEQTIQQYGSANGMTFYHFGFILKREKYFEEAVEAFTVAKNRLAGRERIIVLEQLAIILEHRFNHFDKALLLTKEAQQRLQRDETLSLAFRKSSKKAFVKREIRLERKIFPGQAQKPTK